MKVVLCVIFNHPYPNNIALIKKLYSKRFGNIIFVQPFVQSNRSDVVVSYRGSFNFQGMIVDALSRLEAMRADYVVFLQDDCLLNPYLSEKNIVRELQVTRDVPYFPHFAPLSGSVESWHWMLPTIWKVFYAENTLAGTGVENYRGYLPDAVKAREHVRDRYGINYEPISNVETFRRFGAVSDPDADHKLTSALIEGLFKTAPDGKIEFEFPWLYGTADFSVMSMQSLKNMAQLFGVTAAMNLFVEVAMPTIIAVLHDNISTSASTGWSVNYIWEREREIVSVESALASFANRCAMLHPVKLSSQFAMAEEIINRSGRIRTSWL